MRLNTYSQRKVCPCGEPGIRFRMDALSDRVGAYCKAHFNMGAFRGKEISEDEIDILIILIQ
jgi:hypothetical protein